MNAVATTFIKPMKKQLNKYEKPKHSTKIKPDNSKTSMQNEAITQLTHNFNLLWIENKSLKSQIEEIRSCLKQSKDTEVLLKFEHLDKINQIKQEHENTLSQIRAIHQQEKSILLDKIERKQIAFFNSKNWRNVNFEFNGNSTMKEEIDKLNFIVEEKEYMNIELKEQIITLRDKLSKLQNESFNCQSHDDWSIQISKLSQDNEKLQTELSRITGYREQWLVYKQIIDDETQRNKDGKQQIADIKALYEQKFDWYIKQLIEKEKEIERIKIESKASGFARSSIWKSMRDTNFVDSSVIYDNSRSFTPNAHLYVHDKNNINSQSFVHDINSRPSHLTIEQRLIQNANRIEWKQWFNLLNLSSFYAHLKNDGTWIMTKNVCIKSSLDGSVVSPDKKNLNCQNSQELSLNFHHSMDFNFNEFKNDFSYGNPQNQRESLLNNSTNYKVSGVNISLQWGEKDSKPKLTKSKPRICNVSHSLQNSAKKIPFSDRLDSTENLQIKPSDKSDNIIDESNVIKETSEVNSKKFLTLYFILFRFKCKGIRTYISILKRDWAKMVWKS